LSAHRYGASYELPTLDQIDDIGSLVAMPNR
jgi:hypothetical protein